MTNDYLAITYRMTGDIFTDSARTLDKTIEKDANGLPTRLTCIPFYFLVSHATELYLKSALLKRGLKEGDLKKYDYRHNLDALLKEVQSIGLEVSSTTVDLINGLSPQHKNHTLRYTVLVEGTKTFAPPPSILFPMLEELLLLTRISTMSVPPREFPN